MFLEVTAAPLRATEEAFTPSDDASDESASWFEYVKFLAVAGAAATGLLLGPMLTVLLFSLLVTVFGWLTGGGFAL